MSKEIINVQMDKEYYEKSDWQCTARRRSSTTLTHSHEHD